MTADARFAGIAFADRFMVVQPGTGSRCLLLGLHAFMWLFEVTFRWASDPPTFEIRRSS